MTNCRRLTYAIPFLALALLSAPIPGELGSLMAPAEAIAKKSEKESKGSAKKEAKGAARAQRRIDRGWRKLTASWLDPARSGGGATQASVQRPNFVFVMTDDQALSDQFVLQKTNRLLGGEGSMFKNAYATEPLCCPARATLLTGQYSHNHGVRSNKPPYGSITAFEGRDNTIATWLDDAGYKTGFIGKYLNGPAPDREPGWDSWIADAEGNNDRYSLQDYRLNVNGREEHFGHGAKDYKTDVFTDYGKRFIEDAAGGNDPFMLSIFNLAPHDDNKLPADYPNPLPAERHRGDLAGLEIGRTPSFNESKVDDKASFNQVKALKGKKITDHEEKRRDRLESLLAIDDQVETLYQTLEKTGELDNTVFIFTSDNGYMFGEHRMRAKSKPYQESVRIPLLIRGPGFGDGEIRQDLVAHHDITKTISSLAGAKPGRVLDGRNLTSRSGRSELLLECPACESDLDQGWQALVTHRESYYRFNDGQSESYNLERDPFELSAHEDARTSYMDQRLSEVSECVGDECP